VAGKTKVTLDDRKCGARVQFLFECAGIFNVEASGGILISSSGWTGMGRPETNNHTEAPMEIYYIGLARQ